MAGDHSGPEAWGLESSKNKTPHRVSLDSWNVRLLPSLVSLCSFGMQVQMRLGSDKEVMQGLLQMACICRKYVAETIQPAIKSQHAVKRRRTISE